MTSDNVTTSADRPAATAGRSAEANFRINHTAGIRSTAMKSLLVRAALSAASLTFLVACDKGHDDSGETPEPEIVRPEELVTDTYTAYPSGENACVDSYLTITFRSEPAIGTSGTIRITDEDGQTVDVIDMADVAALSEGKPAMTESSIFTTAMDAVGSSAAGRYRIVYGNPVSVDGNTMTIRPHCDRLEYGRTYSVAIDADAVSAEGFSGISGDEWTFSVMGKPSGAEVTVGARECDFMTVQGAINYASSLGQSTAVTILVEDGVYEEQLYIRNKNNLTIRGESREGTVIRFDNCNDYIPGTGSGRTSVPEPGDQVGTIGGRSVILVENSDMLRFEDISLENTHGHGSQAEVIYFNCDSGRIVARNCCFSGEQDTIELKGWGSFRDCLIRGDVDFIWGYAKAALFESCEIRSCMNDNGGYIVQARCQAGDRGFVFSGCSLTAESGVEDGSFYLARSGGDASCYDNVTYVNCSMGPHISPAGWRSSPTPNPSAASAENGWKEYRSTDPDGVLLDVAARYGGSMQLQESDWRSLYADAQAVFASCPHGFAWAEE